MTKYIQKLLLTCLTTGAGFLAVQNVLSATVYQWTDEEGVVHFSDVAPKGGNAKEIEEIEFVEYAENDVNADRYSISNQLERMAEWRRQVTEERLAQKQLQLEAKRVAQEQDTYRYNNSPGNRSYQMPAYYPSAVYSFPGHFTGFKSHHKHHSPGHRFGHGKRITSGSSVGSSNFRTTIDHY